MKVKVVCYECSNDEFEEVEIGEGIKNDLICRKCSAIQSGNYEIRRIS